MGTKYLAVTAIYNEMASLALADLSGISATIVILIGAVLLAIILMPE